MENAKLFQNGRSQAVRLPRAFRMPGTEVKVSKQGNKVILEPIDKDWDDFFDALSQFSDDFMEDGRQQPPIQQRDSL